MIDSSFIVLQIDFFFAGGEVLSSQIEEPQRKKKKWCARNSTVPYVAGCKKKKALARTVYRGTRVDIAVCCVAGRLLHRSNTV